MEPLDLTGVKEYASEIAQPLRDRLVEDICRRVKEAGAITTTAEYEIYRAEQLGLAEKEIKAAILFEQMMLDDALSNREKGLAALELFFPGILPTGENEAGSAILWFYNCGKPWKRGSTARMRRAGKVFDYDQDDGYIFAAFLEQYGVDLEQVQDLHWWKFKAMFDALRPDCLFSKIVEWRSTDLTQVKDPKEKKFIQEMKQVYRLRKSVDEQEKLDLIADALMGGGDLSKL